jgi:hypothetical protein
VVIYYNPNRNLVTPTFSNVVLQDDFASRENGWDDAGSTRTGGHYYKNRTYRIKAETEPGGEGSTKAGAPRKAENVYPSAETNLGMKSTPKLLLPYLRGPHMALAVGWARTVTAGTDTYSRWETTS